MGKKSPKPPAAPDPVVTATAQTASNKETAYWNAVLNNVNQNTPYGSLSYQQTGGNQSSGEPPPQFTSNITLSPEQQRLYDLQTDQDRQLLELGGDQLQRIRTTASTPFSFGGIGNEINEQGVTQARADAEAALMSRLNPQFAKDEESLRTRLINQGINQGSEAYNNEFDSFGQQQNDARMQAVLAAGQYGGDLQNQALQRRNQSIQEYATQRNAPLNEYIGFTSGTQIQNPQFQSAGYGGAAPVDYAGMVNNQYQSQLGAYNSKVAGRNSTMGSLFGLGGQIASGYAGSAAGSAALTSMFSDIRMKENIIEDGEANGHKMYRFNYIGDTQTYRGVMAQDILETHPEAVQLDEDGMMKVDYGMLGVSMDKING